MKEYSNRNCRYANATAVVYREILSASARPAKKPDVSTSGLCYSIPYDELPEKYALQNYGWTRLRSGTAQVTGDAHRDLSLLCPSHSSVFTSRTQCQEGI